MKAPFFALNKTQLLALAIASVTQAFSANVWAAPEGGQVVAGQGAIQQIEKETRIQQATERLSIDWKNFDVNSDERVKFIQPNSSSIAFNRILSNKGSLIQGQINANGQVVLINPNGIIFTKGSIVNAGGLIASALQMTDQDYLNGKFTLNALEGTEGRVINSGLLNAATGGSISLIGQSVENNGLISAHLGSINLAAGKEAVLTFEPNGLIGVRVTKEVLQKDLGVVSAILNNGEIKAEGGKVLITATTSKDIFSQAVNVGELEQTKSAAVHEDGSFTLGGGADVINTGTVNVGAEGKAGEAVLIGENVTNQGLLSADSQTADAGHIEITAKNINETRDKGTVTAVAHKNGKGGDIKLLGDKVGVLDSAKIDASGANGAGQVLLGGDKTGQNPLIKNAQFLHVGKNTQTKVNALEQGDGGKLIAFAQDTARIYGDLSARGGIDGRGGFIETSGLKGFDLLQSPDVSSLSGLSGNWLIDPFDIEITSDFSIQLDRITPTIETNRTTYIALKNTAKIGWIQVRNVLNKGTGGTVEIKTSNGPDAGTGGTIKISANLDFSETRSVNNQTVGFDSKLILTADKNIEFTNSATELKATNNNRLNLEFTATENINLNNAKILTNGGNFTATATNGNYDATNATISTKRDTGAGDIKITAKGATDLGTMDFSYDYTKANAKELIQIGSVNVTTEGDITLHKPINFNDTAAYTNTGETAWLSSPDSPPNDKSEFNLTSKAGSITLNAEIKDSVSEARDALNISLDAKETITLNNSIFTSGGNFTATAGTFAVASDTVINTDVAHSGGLETVENYAETAARRSEGGNVTLTTDSDIQLGSITTDGYCTQGTCDGNLSIQSRSGKPMNVTQAADSELIIHGTTTFNIKNGNITLTNGSNIFGTKNDSTLIAENKSVALNEVNSVELASASGLLLGNATISGTALFDAATITQNAPLNITGAATLKAETIELDNAENNFSQIASLTAASATLNDMDNIEFKNLTTPNLTITTASNANFNDATINTQDAAVTVKQNGAGTIILGDTLVKNGNGKLTFVGVAGAGLNYSGTKDAEWNLNTKTLSMGAKEEKTEFAFEGFTQLIGGLGDDTVTLSEAVTEVNLDNFDAGFSLEGMDIIKASAENATLTGYKTSSSWLITEKNSGAISTASADASSNKNSTAFSGFSTLISAGENANRDTFTVGDKGVITKIVGQTGDTLNTRSGAGVINNWVINADQTANVSNEAKTAYISVIDGVGTVNGSLGADNFTAEGIYKETINARPGNEVGDTNNSLATNKADVVFTDTEYITNGIKGINSFNAAGETPQFKATAAATHTLEWLINAGTGTTLSGSVKDAESLQTLNFSNFSSLVGGSNNDTFTLESSVFAGGTINAGAPAATTSATTTTQDRLINSVEDTTWDLTTNTLRGINFEGFNSLQGSGTDSINARNTENSWEFNSVVTLNQSILTGFSTFNGGTGADTFTLNIDTSASINGRAGNDFFIVNAGASFAKPLKGGAGDDTLTASNAPNAPNAPNNWTLTDATTGTVNTNVFEDIEFLIGGSGSDTLNANGSTDLNLSLVNLKNFDSLIGGINTSLTGADQKNSWVLSGADEGRINWDTSNPIQFKGFTAITGGAQEDKFSFNTGVLFKGALDGGDGTNELDVSKVAGNTLFSANPDNAINSIKNIALIKGTGIDATLTLASSQVAEWDLTSGKSQLKYKINSDSEFKVLGFEGFGSVTGGNGNDTFTLLTDSTDFIRIDGGTGKGENTLNAKTTTNHWRLAEQKAEQNATQNTDDTLTVNGKNTIKLANIKIYNGSGRDVLTGSNTATQWKLQRDGSLAVTQTPTQKIINATGISAINGGKGADEFILLAGKASEAWNYINTLNGGVSGVQAAIVMDTLDATAVSESIAVRVGPQVLDADAGKPLWVSAIEDIKLNEQSSSVFYGPTSLDSLRWSLLGAMEGQFAPEQNSTFETIVHFSGVHHIYAGDGVDSFSLGENTFKGGIYGGGGVDYLDYSSSVKDVYVGDISTVNNIEGVRGNRTHTQHRLIATGAKSIWQIGDDTTTNTTAALGVGINAGAVTLNNTSINFIDFSWLVGTDNNDSFTLTGNFNGTIEAGGGGDTLKINASPEFTQNITLKNDVNDALTLSLNPAVTTTSNIREHYEPLPDNTERIILSTGESPSQKQFFKLNFNPLAQLNDSLAVDTLTVQTASATAGTNTLALNDNTFQLSSGPATDLKIGTPITLAHKTNVMLRGQSNDTLTLSGNTTFATHIRLDNLKITALGEQNLSADTLVFNEVAGIGSGENFVSTTAAVAEFNTLRGDVFLSNTASITLAALSAATTAASSTFNLTATNGDITQSQPINFSKNINLKSSGTIILDSSNNNFTGALSLTGLDGAPNITPNGTPDVTPDVTPGSAQKIILHNASATTLAQLHAKIFTFNGADLASKNPIKAAAIESITSTGRVNLTAQDGLRIGAIQATELNLAVAGDINLGAVQAINATVEATGAIALSGDIKNSGNLSLIAAQLSSEKPITLGGDFLANVGAFTQSSDATLTALGGINIASTGDSLLGVLSTQGRASILAGGAIKDTNGEKINITASHVTLGSGMGTDSDLNADILVGKHTGENAVVLSNNKTLQVDHLIADGDVTLNVAGGSLIINNATDNKLVTLRSDTSNKHGVINAKKLNITAPSRRDKKTPSIFARGGNNKDKPDLVADSMVIDGVFGIGTYARPLTVEAKSVRYLSAIPSAKPYFATAGTQFEGDNIVDVKTLLLAAGDQLIEIEPMENINPAVFTDVRNYTALDTAIMLPVDQLGEW